MICVLMQPNGNFSIKKSGISEGELYDLVLHDNLSLKATKVCLSLLGVENQDIGEVFEEFHKNVINHVFLDANGQICYAEFFGEDN